MVGKMQLLANATTSLTPTSNAASSTFWSISRFLKKSSWEELTLSPMPPTTAAQWRTLSGRICCRSSCASLRFSRSPWVRDAKNTNLSSLRGRVRERALPSSPVDPVTNIFTRNTILDGTGWWRRMLPIKVWCQKEFRPDVSRMLGEAKLAKSVLLVSEVSEATIILSWNWTRESRHLASQPSNADKQRIQIVSEPMVVLPQAHKARNVSSFTSRVLLGRPPTVKGWEYSPQEFPPKLEIAGSEGRIHRSVMILANKFSFIQGEQYSLRRAVVSGSDKVDVYGKFWDLSNLEILKRLVFELGVAFAHSQPLALWQASPLRRPRTYLGAPQLKGPILSRYKVALVIENSQEFISEKLFDAFFAGCMPVYVGPEPKLFGIPNELVIHSAPEPREILSGIDEALETYGQSYIKLLSDWVSSPDTYERWSSSEVLRRIIYGAPPPKP